MVAGGRRHVRGGDVGLVICVEFISHSNLTPPQYTPKLQGKLLKYPVYITLSILTGSGAWTDAR